MANSEGGNTLANNEEHEQLLQAVTERTKINQKSVKSVIHLLEEGNTVPFIARYRKEQTGSLDEVQIKDIQDAWQYVNTLNDRKAEVIRLIEEQGKLTDQLRIDIEKANQLQKVEDLYRPYKQKRRTRATIAKEKGLAPLAKEIYQTQNLDIEAKAKEFLSEEHELHNVEDVLAGVQDIIAEWLADEPTHREHIRKQTFQKGLISATVKKAELDEKKIYEMYYEYSESVSKIVSHRILALNRGEKEGVLKVSIEPPTDHLLAYLQKQVTLRNATEQIKELMEQVIEDSYKRLTQPSVEREIRAALSEKAEEQAIDIFSKNLKSLLLQPPLKGKYVLGVDPAFRTGCKLAVIDDTGKVKAVDVMYPTAPKHDTKGAEGKVMKFINEFPIELIAIGNGTASRESEQFIANVIENNQLDVAYIIVNEAGASVYSASKLAREEFPDLQVEERSAVSIARRIQDPLAELVKIEPKAIGVGQYQHDVSQKKLTGSLTFVVETAVNQVGVNVNTASSSLLQYVSGLNKTVANNVIKYRDENGKFTNRKQLKDIPRLGNKTYEQSIGFLRVMDGDEPLDRTPIHPESYPAAKQILKEINSSVDDLGSEKLKELIHQLDKKTLANQLDIGLPTLEDILKALISPNRDPRDDLPQPLLKKNVLSMEDLQSGMELQGTVRNVVDFGVFVDIGVKQDGLVHISKMSNQFVKHPMDLVSVGDVITVWVDQVDQNKQRIALSMVND
ncbi:RNA-binding transcriptional accessory protein [Gracilibacillus caseinilyticus]|uniref:RNA-binding transcriptional accessory protein n=1 Tax=Gracilibacillus caseinilyticus TaxID=2932256 RepID=A0ABY4EXF9_9BACI|nr:Tex family protein [Gracilibacillus caseinilyticus]UOQ49104.1 RNA-binding transcriptional accessory protein [Gracilibacillus caseinilyticus]